MGRKWICLLHGGFEPEVLHACRGELEPAALEALRRIAGAGMLLGAALTMVGLSLEAVPGLWVVCLMATLACVAAEVLACTILPRQPRAVLLVWYAMLLVCCLAAIWADTALQPDYSAVAFLALELALPLLLPDVPWRGSIFMAVMAVLFAMLCLHCKAPALAWRDIFHCIGFYLAGTACGYHAAHSRVDDLLCRSLLRQQRDTDCLTGLYTRRYCEAAIGDYLATCKHSAALLLLDVDRFKQVNDLWGHDRGDELLQVLSQQLRNCFRRGDVLGRLGGDEFIAFLPNCPRDTVECRVKDLLRAVDELAECNSVPVAGVSVGVAMYPIDGESFDTLYHGADGALYVVKARGRGHYAFCDEADAAPSSR